MIFVCICIFIASCFLLFWSGSKLVLSLTRVARYLNWREFVVAFFVMAFAGSAPNLFIGINSALHKIPQFGFAEIIGGNLVDLTIAVALAVLIGGSVLRAKSSMVQASTIFTFIIAVLPLILILDGTLSRIDGLILISVFLFYVFWLFSKAERFKKIYNKNKLNSYNNNNHINNNNEKIDKYNNKKNKHRKPVKRFRFFIRDLAKVFLFLFLLLLASEGVVTGAQAFSSAVNISLPIIGILIVGVGNAIPETYFAIASAKKGQTWMILGDLMGSVIVCATLVLGIIALICPIVISDFTPFALGGAFLVIAAGFFLIVIRSDQKVTKGESIFLLCIYFVFLILNIIL